MKVSAKMTGLGNLDKLLDSLTDPKFRAAALRRSAKQAMEPVKQVLESKAPSLVKPGVVLQTTVNTNKKMKINRIKQQDRGELFSQVTFKNDYYGMAMILEHGRSKRLAKTSDGKVFHSWGKATKYVERDIGTTEPKNFVSETATQTEALMVNTFSSALVSEVEKQAKRMNRARGKSR
ncbi:hypothetical protein HLBENOHH_02472 [Aeromonas dhakensis]|uniref:hypothetical protein n=1 Tax=Aeromonas dhakensis TaxID=196024 RepID=UPI003671AD0B